MVEKLIKLKLSGYTEQDLILPDYCNGKFASLNDEDLLDLVEQIIHSALEINGIYFDYDDYGRVTQRLISTIKPIILAPENKTLREDFNLLEEFVTYIASRLG